VLCKSSLVFKPCKGARKKEIFYYENLIIHIILIIIYFALTGLDWGEIHLTIGLHPMLIYPALSGLVFRITILVFDLLKGLYFSELF
jgi:hypothetical protein